MRDSKCRLKALHRLGALRRNRNRELRRLVLDGVEPMRIGARVLKETIARAERALQRIDAALVLGIDCEDETVEEAAPLRRRSHEKLVHGGDQPDHAQVIGEGRRRANRLAIDAAGPRARRVVRGRGLDTGAERGEAKHALDLGCDRPGAVALGKRYLLESGAAQAPSRDQEGDRFDQIGLAGAVRSGQHHEIGRDLDTGRVVAAEVGQRQAADQGGGHTRDQ